VAATSALEFTLVCIPDLLRDFFCLDLHVSYANEVSEAPCQLQCDVPVVGSVNGWRLDLPGAAQPASPKTGLV
jgi:hypothetical protein